MASPFKTSSPRGLLFEKSPLRTPVRQLVLRSPGEWGPARTERRHRSHLSFGVEEFLDQSVPPAEFPRNLKPHPQFNELSLEEQRFWQQPDGGGFKPCIEPSGKYKKLSANVTQEKDKYLMVVVGGGLNQMRAQICDAVVLARVLGAALVVPIMQVNFIWQDWSEFADVFDVAHFKRTLEDDVRIVTSLPSTHVQKRVFEEKNIPYDSNVTWFIRHLRKKLEPDRVVLLRGLDARLTPDLPPDLQKLRCKVEFHALQFVRPVHHLGLELATRLHKDGPYVALHLRLEKDVWIRTGCLPGLSPELDAYVVKERARNSKYLTGRMNNVTFEERRLRGMCPLTAADVVKLLHAFGATKRTRIFWAGGEPFGGVASLAPLTKAFPRMFTKESLALPGELDPFRHRSNLLAAIDFLICMEANIFMPSHGGNMGHVLQGFRAYYGHRKHITPNKRDTIRFLLNNTLSQEEVDKAVLAAQRPEHFGIPQLRTSRRGRDVVAFPVPECMCSDQVYVFPPSLS
eukprot:jgi/Mesen1/1138/ME000123S00308